MKNLVNLSGSICKNEVLTPLTSNILGHTFVCEATSPYANYYGQVPQKPKPNFPNYPSNGAQFHLCHSEGMLHADNTTVTNTPRDWRHS